MKPGTLRIVIISVVLLALLSIGIYLVVNFSDDGGKILNVRVTNVTSNAATISWMTEKPFVGKVYYSEDNNWFPIFEPAKAKAYDDRDTEINNEGELVLKSEKQSDRYSHHVTIRNLDPNKTYYFRIAGYLHKTFAFDITSFNTLSVTEEINTPDPIYGRVKNYAVGENDPVDGIVYYRIVTAANDEGPKSAWYSSPISSTSSWTGDLSQLYAEDGSRFSWTAARNDIELESETEVGGGVTTQDLDNYKPISDINVNIRYFYE